MTHTRSHNLSYSIEISPLSQMDDQTADESIIFAALSTLTHTKLSFLSLSLSTTFRRHSRRLAHLLSSPILFYSTLNHLYSLPLPHKSLLIARHLLSTLHLLTPYLPPPHSNSTPPTTAPLSLRDLDSALLLLLFCELRQHDPKLLEASAPEEWHRAVTTYFSRTTLTLSGIEASHEEVLGDFVDVVVTCRRFAGSAGCAGKAGREVAAAVAAVVALPAVEVKGGGGGECVVCKEEMREGREVCELPCGHLFHWWCVLPWFRKRNTCPCCRFRLPTDDVYGEIERLWEVLVRVGRPVLDADQCI
ncbi:hypothetical protein Dimus_007247 [Dionaea muscipula]